MRLLLRGSAPRWLTPVLMLLAVGITFGLTAGPIRLAGANPLAAYERYVITPFTTSHSVFEVLLASTPLMFTGLAVLVAFRSGYFNIGAEGQFLTGAIAATWVGMGWSTLPAWAALILGLLAGAVAGALWGTVPALLRVRFDIDEVVTTLLLNPVALLIVQGLLNGPWRNPTSQFPESTPIGAGYELPRILSGSRVHAGFVVAVLLAVVLWLVLTRTPLGMTMRAVGLSRLAASFAGINVERTLFGAALTSAGIAGLGGAVQVMGLQHQLTGEISSGFGYTGIVVATLAALSVPAALAVAVLLADITVGAESAARALQLPPQMGRVLTATLLLVTVSVLVFRRYRLALPARWRLGAPGQDAATPESVPAQGVIAADKEATG